MTGYGNESGLMPLSDETTFMRFDAQVGTTWVNNLGLFTVETRDETLQIKGKSYMKCIRIRQLIDGLVFLTTLCPGVGIIQYNVAGQDFQIDEAASALPLAGGAANPLPPVGILPNAFANQVDSPEAALARIELLKSGPVSFLLAYGNWSQLEPSPGVYSLDSIRFHVYEVATNNWTSAYTLSIIDMHRRDVPADLQSVAWNDSRMRRRVLKLMDALAAEFQGKVAYFQFGNEVDTYFTDHPNELNSFLSLFNAAKARLKQRAPNIKVSMTFKHLALAKLATTYKALDDACDLLALTYGPYTPEYDALPPAAVSGDIAAMKSAAKTRKVLLQEIAYPSSPTAGSSPWQQAEFYGTLLAELRASRSQIAGAQIFLMSDLSQAVAANLASALGLGFSAKFHAVVSSIGLFDASAQPKLAWQTLTQQLRQ